MSLISVALLQEKIAQTVRFPTPRTVQTVSLLDSLGRVLAKEVRSLVNLPSANVSAMDGYALFDEAQKNSVWRIIGESSAGQPFSGSLKPNQCVKIMTGAVVPDEAKTVVMQENVVCDEVSGCITLLNDAPLQRHIRYQGEEVALGQTVLTEGHILRAADILLLASLGVKEVVVYSKLKVALLSSGDELLSLGENAQTIGQIHDSNRPSLMARLRDFPIEIIDLGKVKDDLNSVKNALSQATDKADVIITSGGVSVGKYDYFRKALEDLGTIHHYKVAMKPGKPFVFGQIQAAWYFGLPGNPISGWVGFDLFVKAALWRLAGAKEVPETLSFSAKWAQEIKKSKGRMEVVRANIWQDETGQWWAKPMGAQDSHRVLGLQSANAYAFLPEECEHIAAETWVKVQPFFDRFL